MAAFIDLVRSLLEGSVRLREAPRLGSAKRDPVVALLAAAYQDHQLDVAGPPLPFVPDCALRAAEFLAWSCWFLLHRGQEPAEVLRCLVDLPPARSAAAHLSADLLFRFLPQVHRRARAVDPEDPLTRRLEDTLRRWPLSGVLADLDNPPHEPVELEGHRGLLLLYAERLVERPRPAWIPTSELGRQCAELVFAEHGLPLPEPERSLT